MDPKKTAEGLHSLERKVLPEVSKESPVSEIIKKTGLSEVEVMRALQWLSNKNLVDIKKEQKKKVILAENGKKYVREGLPEKRFAKIIEKKELKADEIKKKCGFDDSELNVCIGLMKKIGAINIKPGMVIELAEQGEKFLSKKSLEEKFLERLSKEKVEVENLEPEEKLALENLQKRKGMIEVVNEKSVFASITKEGSEVAMEKMDGEMIDSLSPLIIKSGSWKGKKFRRYDVKINVPSISGGKRHFVSQSIEYAKRIWTDLGFKEMEGPLLNTSFWNFDALFTAQDHPVRDMQDTFFLKNPAKGKLPDKDIVEQVKKAHEKGVCGSQGWGYEWNPEEAKKNVLRTHTTVLSSKTIASLKKEDLPAKFFAVGRCFRNETVDWSHLFEFNQTEGIVVDPDGNFRNLLGYLKEFFRKMGYPKARFRPAHFPYTEPSVEIDVYHPEKKTWVELGGAGMFRPEVVYPLFGKDVKVLAWGPGFDRIMTEFFGITDIRDLYSNNIEQIRNMKFWNK